MLLKNDQLALAFSANGGLKSLYYRGREFIAVDAPAVIFTLLLRDTAGKPLTLTSLDFSQVRCVEESYGGGKALNLLFSGYEALEAIEVLAKIRLDNDTAFSRWSLKISHIPAGFYCDNFLFPQLELANTLCSNGGDGEFFWPGMEGTVFRDFQPRIDMGGFASKLLEYPLNGVGGYYPGPVPMQFQAYCTGKGSLYFGCHDLTHAPKGIDVDYGATGNIRPWLQFFPGGEFTDEVASPEELVIGGFTGDWQDACMIYRNWMEKHDHSLPLKLRNNPDAPEWLKDSPVLLAYPVKGSGFDTGSLEGNEYFPYDKGLAVCDFYRERWHTPVMALLMHWEGTAPWAPPYVWPPYGGARMLKDFADKLHAGGNLLGVYCSGTAWTSTSSIDPRYSMAKEFAEQHLEREMCIGPQGEMFARVCQGEPGKGQRIGFDSCVARPWVVDTVVEEIRKSIDDTGIDYMQYFDQNQGCSAPLCYAKTHNHPGSPGAWLTDAMTALLDKARAVVKQVAPQVVLGCENAAAQPYIKNLLLNDLRNHLSWSYSQPVPAYSMVFHEYVNNFTGNGVGLGFWFDREKSPWFILHRMAYSFICGEILSVLLRDNMQMHWCWVCSWDDAPPEQESLLELIANMTAWRRQRAKNFLVFGRMEKNVRVRGKSRTLHFLTTNPPLDLTVVLASRWSFQGTEAVILVNPSGETQTVEVTFEKHTEGVCRLDPGNDAGSYAFAGKTAEFTLPAYQVIMLELTI